MYGRAREVLLTVFLLVVIVIDDLHVNGWNTVLADPVRRSAADDVTRRFHRRRSPDDDDNNYHSNSSSSISDADDDEVGGSRNELAAAAESIVWEHAVVLDPPHANYHLFWTPGVDDIAFRVEVRTTGYVGFGLSKNGRMANSDILVGWVRDGKPFVQDRHGTSRSEPLVDKTQNWHLLSGSENETHTVLVFRRKYDTCDRHDLKITNDTWRVIYAYHKDDPDVVTNSIQYHGRPHRGVKSILLTQHVSRPASPTTSMDGHFATVDAGDPDAILNWDLRSHRVTLPEDDDTLYWCKLFKLPEHIKSKHHMIGYEPLIQPGNEGYMHHVLIYECKSRNHGETQEFEQVVASEGHLCYEPTISSVLKSCDKLIGVWAIGSEGFFMPDNIGYPLDPDSGVGFVKMEIHYDNPYLQDGIKDSSGIRLYYTPRLRAIEAGVLSIGIDPNWKHLIPPKQSATVSYGHCISKCTKKAFPTDGISVFAAILHSHLLGRKIQLRHIRGDRELPPIAIDGNYDFEYQEYRVFRVPVKVLPGDHMIAECTYNSRGRDRMTQGGFTTREEMCLVFVYYHPKVDMSLCHSIPTMATVYASVGVREVYTGRIPAMIKSPAAYANKSLAEHFDKYDWSKNMKLYHDVVRTGSFEITCGKHGQSLLQENEVHYYPNISRAYSEPRGCVTGRHGVTGRPVDVTNATSDRKDDQNRNHKKHNNNHHHRKKDRATTPTSTRADRASDDVTGGSRATTPTVKKNLDSGRSAASPEVALSFSVIFAGLFAVFTHRRVVH